MAPNPLADLGAGLSTKSVETHPLPPQHGPASQAERAFTAASTFMSGIMAISATQFLGAPLKMIDPKFYEAYMAFTKQSFGVLITTMTQWWSPTVVRVSGDRSIPKQLFHKPDGTLECRFPKRLVMMANHQLYTDWLYLWWVAYTNNMHGYIYIILKESLKNIPVVGWGCQFYNFIFLSRKWETDRRQFKEHLDQLNKENDPMWLLIFPEGTNLAKGTREKSKAWAEKTGVQDMKHQLLPRSKGIQFCLQNLRKTTEWLYDCTIGYEGIPPGQFGQDIFTLRSSMFEGRPPKSVNMHFRRFKISEIPIDNDVAFEVWLRNRWREKDYLLEHFVQYNRFPEDDKWLVRQKQTGRKGAMNAKFIETQIKSNSLEEFLSIFAPLSSVMMVLFLFYGGSNPNDLLKMIGEAAQQQQNIALLRDDASTKEPLKLQKVPKDSSSSVPSLASFDFAPTSMTPAAAQRNLIQKYITAVRPAAASTISLPDRSLRVSNAGKGAVVQKKPISSRAQSVVSAPVGRPPTLGSRRPSIATISTAQSTAMTKDSSIRSWASSVSTAPSTKPKITATSRPFVNGANTSTVQPKATTLPKKTETDKDTPVYKVDKATYDKLQQQNKAKDNAKKIGPRSVSIDPAILQKLKAKEEKEKGKKTEPKSVNIDPAILQKMKLSGANAIKAPGIQQKGPKGVQIDPGILAKMKEGKK